MRGAACREASRQEEDGGVGDEQRCQRGAHAPRAAARNEATDSQGEARAAVGRSAMMGGSGSGGEERLLELHDELQEHSQQRREPRREDGHLRKVPQFGYLVRLSTLLCKNPIDREKLKAILEN